MHSKNINGHRRFGLAPQGKGWLFVVSLIFVVLLSVGLTTLKSEDVLHVVLWIQQDRTRSLVAAVLCLLLIVPWLLQATDDHDAHDPRRLKCFTEWVVQQVEELGPEQARHMLDDVICTFSKDAHRARVGFNPHYASSPTSHKLALALQRLSELASLLEKPGVNRSVRMANWALASQWELKILNPKERYEVVRRCTVVLPTIIEAVKSVQKGKRSRGHDSFHGLRYLANWCEDFLQRSDVLVALQDQSSREPTPITFLAPDDESESSYSEEEYDSPSSNEKQRSCMAPAISADASSQHSSQGTNLFVRYSYPGMDNCWDDADATVMNIRSRTYLQDRKKVRSAPSLFELVELDMFTSRSEIQYYAMHPSSVVQQQRQKGDARFFLVVNWRFPPIQLGCVFAAPDGFDLRNGETPEERLFRRFLVMCDSDRNKRFKVLPKVTDAPWIVKKSVGEKPAIIGKRIVTEYFVKSDHVEISVNVFSSSAAKHMMGLMQGASKKLGVEVFVLLEAQQADELPERILGSFSCYRMDTSRLRRID